MRKKSKKRVISNIIFNIIALVSTIVAIVFCIYLFNLDILPAKYLRIIFIGLGVFYLILLGVTLPRKMRIGFKIVACVFLVIFAFVFGFGIKYVDKTAEFVNKINDELKQKEDYQISAIKEIKKEDIDGKKIGIFKNGKYDKIIELLKKKYPKIEIIDYDDPVKIFEDLSNDDIELIIASDNVYELLQTDLNYLNISLKNMDVLSVPVDSISEDVVKVVDVTNTPFNIYVGGGDAYGSINKVMNTDVNMVVTVDPVNHKMLLTSIPRDYYVVLPSKGDEVYDKLTHAGYYGIGESVKAVEKLLDIDINYYAKVNFSTIEKIVDAIGGVDINNPRAFTSSDRVTHFNKGDIHLNGHQALMYARERQSFADGDVQRVKNQQKILEAIIGKISSSKTIISRYTDLLDSISSSFSTNLDTKSISRLIKLQLSDMRGWDMESQNLVGHSATSTKCYSIPNLALYVMKQDADSVQNASNKIKEMLEKK